jgi:branched-chain amino acid transport system permease protein
MKIVEFIHSGGGRIALAAAVALLLAVACPHLLGGGQYAFDMVQVALAFALIAAAWDFLCGLTGETSFGHSLFVGVAAYAAALAEARWGVGPVGAALVGAGAGALAGGLVGLLTLRQAGAVFAMVTMASQLTFHRALFMWSGFFGGEEGVAMPRRLVESASGQYWLAVAAAVGGLLALLLLRETSFGRQLKASGGDTRVGVASGVAVPRVRVAGTVVSALLAGVGGVLLATQSMVATHELAGDALAGLIFLLAVVGGTGTLLGPWLAALVYVCGLRHVLSPLGRAEPVIVFGLLLMLVWIMPDGIGNALKRLGRRGAPSAGREVPE